MKKTLIGFLLLISTGAFAQYTPMFARGYQFKYVKTDSGYVFPVRDTVNTPFKTFGSAVVRPQDSALYIYTNKWNKTSAGAAVLSNKVDSVKITTDTLYYYINGVAHGQVFTVSSLYPNSFSFNTSTGNATIGRNGTTSLTANFDGRYSLTTHTHSGLAPIGGNTGQVLKKISGTDYDYTWSNDNGGVTQAQLDDTAVAIRADIGGGGSSKFGLEDATAGEDRTFSGQYTYAFKFDSLMRFDAKALSAINLTNTFPGYATNQYISSVIDGDHYLLSYGISPGSGLVGIAHDGTNYTTYNTVQNTTYQNGYKVSLDSTVFFSQNTLGTVPYLLDFRLKNLPNKSFAVTDSAMVADSVGKIHKVASSYLIEASATLDFANTAPQTSTDLTVTVTGAVDGDVVTIGVPNASVNANSCYTAWVSSSNTVTIRFNNYDLTNSINPASGTFKVKVIK